ncbi:hypothetical protein XA68_16381 [Ophiocordyceps unilateralis]|uniref:Peroxisomal ATPase PEX6 n=1 Tax=Ophiocordyceps unilateralis TaxID=268505 RepID=A0A2A9PL45_OPHUN|nr:hypothetical protein XA68_16381 [Ophiocordyceps unilateralis]
MTAPTAAPLRRLARRRRPDKPAVSASLVLDTKVKSDAGLISHQLFADLFPHLADSPAAAPHDDQNSPVYHVAISPWLPNPTPSDTAWTILPVVRSAALPPSALHFSPFSQTLQSFAAILQQIAPSKLSGYSRAGIEILVLDVAPLPLDTVFVSLESESTKRLENGEGTFHHREHPAHHQGNKASGLSPTELLADAIRTSLAALDVVHTGDSFPLPLAPHPVTHTPPNPAVILLCEPVAQGILTDSTKIVLMRGRLRPRRARRNASMTTHHLKEVAEDEDDAHDDHFFSAAEDRHRNDGRADQLESVDESETDAVSEQDELEDELSDDSMDDMISLQTPALPATSTSAQPGTPMSVSTLRGRRTNGVTSPGSIFSNMTSTTARPDQVRGRLFKAHGLLEPISSELLHPAPSPEDDEEARVYVDMSSLPKLGCFSGDWARIEAAEEPPSNGFGPFGLGSFGQAEPETTTWRPVRVFGLPEVYSQRPLARIASSDKGERNASFFGSQVQRMTTPAAYASPILLANLDKASYLRISALKRSPLSGRGAQSRLTNASHPPYAKNIAIHHIRTPISSERAYQTAVLGGLKRYFARKIRLVRTGDLIAVPVDTKLGQVLREGTGAEVDDVMALTAGDCKRHIDSVAWFKVSHIQMQKSDEDEDEAAWGSVACIDSSAVGMHGTGFETSRVPGVSQSTWPYYLGLRKAPRQSSDSLSSLLERRPPFTSPLRRQLRELVSAATSPAAVHLKLPPVAVLLTSRHRNIGKATLVRSACADVGLHTYSIDAYDILSDGGGSGNDVKTDGFLRTRAERAMSCGPDCCVLLIQHLEALTADRIEATMKEIVQHTRVLIATTNEVDQVHEGLRAIFTHELEMDAPDEAEREAILGAVVDDRGVSLEPTLKLASIALKTAALVAGDLVDVVERASLAQQARLQRLSARKSVTLRDVEISGGPEARSLISADWEVAVEAARKNLSDSIGAPKIPNVTWDDVGGLGNVKEAVAETIQLPLERPELFARGMKKRSGILFYGPPGTGKTLLAKAIATEYSLNFFSVKGPELLNMYIGESEANVRRVFQRARDARPCVVFFDELDSVAPKRGNQGDSGGVMDRIVSQLLAELDGMSGGHGHGHGHDGSGVFVIGATNRPDLLDPALLRPGRFDKMLYLGVSDTHEKQLTILEALTRKSALSPLPPLPLSPSFSLSQRLPLTYTGADLYALCSDAMLKAVTRQAASIDASVEALNAHRQRPISTAAFFDHHASPAQLVVRVSDTDFDDAQRELTPSVSLGELRHYERVRAAFEGADELPRGPALATTSKHRSSHHERAAVDGGEEGKGKGKGKAVVGFRDGTASDDDGLY